MTEDETRTLGREIHGMWHGGASAEKGLTRLKCRLATAPGGSPIDDMPPALRAFTMGGVRIMFRTMWGKRGCRSKLGICDAAHKV
jgi:hypothetical protein